MSLSHPMFPISLLPSKLEALGPHSGQLPDPSCPRNPPIPAPLPLCILFLDTSHLLLHPCRPEPRSPKSNLPSSVQLSHQLGQRREGSLRIIQWFSNCAPRPRPVLGATVAMVMARRKAQALLLAPGRAAWLLFCGGSCFSMCYSKKGWRAPRKRLPRM